MIDLMLLALLAKADAAYVPPPETFYHQAVACIASALAEQGKSPKDYSGEAFGDMMTWGMILADNGRKIGRTRKQVDSGDVDTALPYFRHLKEKKREAFAAHRAYCRGLFVADRP